VSADIKQKTTDLFSKEVSVPENFNFIARIFLGIEGEIEFSKFVILAVLWIFLFIIILKVLEVVIDKAVIRWIAAFIITSLAGMSKGVYYGSTFFLGLVDLFKFEWGLWKIILGLLFISILLFVFFALFRWIKNKSKKEELEQVGEKAGVSAKVIGKVGEEMFKDGGGI